MAILVFEHGPRAGINRLGAVLRDNGHTMRFIKLHEGQPLPPDLDDVHGIVTCGGSVSVADDSTDDLPWLDEELRLLRQAAEVDIPVVGLCLGSQILAKAFGGSVGRIESGIHLGWQPVKLTEPGKVDAIHTGVPWTTIQFHWNRDEVSELPDDATLLATSERCRVQAWALGIRMYGFQYHPEIREETPTQWIDDDPEALQEGDLSRDDLLRQTEQYYREMRRITERMFNSIALLLMPVDRRFAGITKDLHH